MPVVTASQLQKLTFAIFEKLGAPPEAAEIVSNYTVDTHLYGHDTHGLLSVPRYAHEVKVGKIRPRAQLEVIRRDRGTALLDGHQGFGYVSAVAAMQLAIELAQENGISAVGVTNCNHIGMLWGYAKMAVDQGLIGIVLCNSGPLGGGGLTAPYGGKRRFLGANPLAWGLPAGEMTPLIMDMSTSIVAAGKVSLARDKGESLPEGWILDKDGRPTTDPNDLLERGGALLPFGGYKGYGLSLLVEMLGGILTGYGCAYSLDFPGGNGLLMVVIDVDRFVPLKQFRRQADELLREIKKVPTDSQTSEILYPGEPEFRARKTREREGIAIPERTWDRVTELASELGLSLEELVG